jgi:hypothetical protein
MTANNANSKISIENCQRFMKRQVVQNKNYSSLGPLSIGTIAVGGHGWEENRSDSHPVRRWNSHPTLQLSGWSRPSGQDKTCYPALSISPKVLRRLKPQQSAGFMQR